ncbi:MAG: coproporphyrinogen dehydrogenase HemZ [Lachnospiraceae bacterium]|nr:coproporphyrinogen dehydrogenase HemZ [Lachnospiraceae bacterium]
MEEFKSFTDLGEKEDINENSADSNMTFYIELFEKSFRVSVRLKSFSLTFERNVQIEGSFLKHEDGSKNPHRLKYKNELKRTILQLVRSMMEEVEKDSFNYIYREPTWGTLTGIRPTKNALNYFRDGLSFHDVSSALEKEYALRDDKKKLIAGIASKEFDILNSIGMERVHEGYSLYIGIPFCPTRCEYCSFAAYKYSAVSQYVEDYLKVLKKEIKEVSEKYGSAPLSIYIGGGTPTALNCEELKVLLDCVNETFDMDKVTEYTCEAGRPDSLDYNKLRLLKDAGVQRISINPQTMNDDTLKLIGRAHNVSQVKEIFSLAKKCGFDSVNADLIAGLPGESLEDFCYTLNELIELAPDNITVHSLVVKRASALRPKLEEEYSKGLKDLKDESENSHNSMEEIILKKDILLEKMIELSCEKLEKHGYMPYYMYRQKNAKGHFGSSGQENIGFSKAGKECLYNILIMEEVQSIIGVGAGASTKAYDKDKQIVKRTSNVKSLTDYIERGLRG